MASRSYHYRSWASRIDYGTVFVNRLKGTIEWWDLGRAKPEYARECRRFIERLQERQERGANRWYERHVGVAEKKLKAMEEAREEGRLLEFIKVAEKVAAGWREERELEKLRTLAENLSRGREGQEEMLIFRTMANSIASGRAAYARVNEMISRQFEEDLRLAPGETVNSNRLRVALSAHVARLEAVSFD